MATHPTPLPNTTLTSDGNASPPSYSESDAQGIPASAGNNPTPNTPGTKLGTCMMDTAAGKFSLRGNENGTSIIQPRNAKKLRPPTPTNSPSSSICGGDAPSPKPMAKFAVTRPSYICSISVCPEVAGSKRISKSIWPSENMPGSELSHSDSTGVTSRGCMGAPTFSIAVMHPTFTTSSVPGRTKYSCVPLVFIATNNPYAAALNTPGANPGTRIMDTVAGTFSFSGNENGTSIIHPRNVKKLRPATATNSPSPSICGGAVPSPRPMAKFTSSRALYSVYTSTWPEVAGSKSTVISICPGENMPGSDASCSDSTGVTSRGCTGAPTFSMLVTQPTVITSSVPGYTK